MKNEIKVGSEVRLKTGGPVMTVKAIEVDRALCEWQVVGRSCAMHFKLKSLLPAAEVRN